MFIVYVFVKAFDTFLFICNDDYYYIFLSKKSIICVYDGERVKGAHNK